MVAAALLEVIGRSISVPIKRKTDLGYVLSVSNEEILLPARETNAEYSLDQLVEVFIYTDSRDRVVATTRTPLARVGDFACLRVVDRNVHGAFLDWGLEKDLFCPNAEQHERMEVGKSYVVAVFLDNRTGRVAAASRLGEFFDYDLAKVNVGDQVDALVYGGTERGFQVIVNDRYAGMLFRDKTFAPIEVGQRIKAFVESVREDNKLDLNLDAPGKRPGRDKRRSDQDVVLTALDAAGGVLPLGDKSTPESVYATLGISKKSFKATVGQLYRRGLVVPGPWQTISCSNVGSSGSKKKG